MHHDVFHVVLELRIVIVCWSPKGGSGTSVVASVLALELSRIGHATIADLKGDVSTILGVDTDGERPGLKQWMLSSPDLAVGAAQRLTTEVTPTLDHMSPGPVATNGVDFALQAVKLRQAFEGNALIVDVGVPSQKAASALVEAADFSVMVIRPCYLAVRRAAACQLNSSGFVLVNEAGRSLESEDVESVLGVPLLASIDWDPAVARLVDAGRTKSRLPRSLRPLKKLAATISDARGEERRVS